jgi:hypothetical protein
MRGGGVVIRRLFVVVTMPLCLDGAQYARRERDNRPHQLEHTVYGDSDDAERQQQQPDQRVKHQGKQRQGPAEHEKNAPQKELDHTCHRAETFCALIVIYG